MLRLRAAALRNFLSVIGDIKEGAGIPTSSRGSWAPLRPLSRDRWQPGTGEGGAQALSLPHPGPRPCSPSSGRRGEGTRQMRRRCVQVGVRPRGVPGGVA